MPAGEKAINRRLTASYLTSVVSIMLVLFMLGLVGILLLNAKKLADYVRENIGISVYIQENTREVDIFNLQKMLDSKQYVKETRYITKEQAADQFKKELGEDFVEFLGYNPLPASIDVRLESNYANPDSFQMMERWLKKYHQVADVVYQKDLIYAVNQNIRKISMILLAFSILLFLIALTLINNTIRLSVYAKRFIIRTMQLVGAQPALIRRPFLFRALSQGFLASLCAMALLVLTMGAAEQQMEGIFNFRDFRIMGLLFATLLISGVLIAWVSTWFSVNKYLKMKTDYLYT